jgi:hypothetical protein
MERIGLAASKMAQGNLLFYNFYVIVLSFLFAVLIFLLAGSAVVFSLIILRYISHEVTGTDVLKDWTKILTYCLVTLSVLMGFFVLAAISKNLKFKKPKT